MGSLRTANGLMDASERFKMLFARYVAAVRKGQRSSALSKKIIDAICRYERENDAVVQQASSVVQSLDVTAARALTRRLDGQQRRVERVRSGEGYFTPGTSRRVLRLLRNTA